MAPWDDPEVNSDGDELLDWLWDLPDRYDVGIEDGPSAPNPLADEFAPSGVRKRLRRPGEPDVVAPIPPVPMSPPAGLVDDRPTIAMDPVEMGAEQGYEYDTALSPVVAPVGSAGFSRRDLSAVAALVLVVLVASGAGYVLLGRKGTSKSHLAVGNPATTATVAPGPASSDPTTSDTTPPTSTTALPAGAPAGLPVAAGTTTTTTRRTTTTAKSVPPPVTTVFIPASTTTTMATTTTTAVPPSTTTTSTTTSSTTTTQPHKP